MEEKSKTKDIAPVQAVVVDVVNHDQHFQQPKWSSASVGGQSTFLLFGVLVISDDNPLQAIFEWLYDAYAFGIFKMQGWVILGFAPSCWLFNYVVTGSLRLRPWKPVK